MIEALTAEFRKIRRRRVWVIVASMILVQMLWFLWGIQRMDAHDLSQGWLILLYRLPLLNSIMMPVTSAVVASRLCDIEHKGQTLKLLNTVMSARKLFTAKFICGALYMLSTVLLQLLVIVAAGNAAGCAGDPPYDKLFCYLLFTMAVNLTILLLQQILSLLFKNQMIPFTVGIIGSFAGLFLLFLPRSLERFILWGYYGVLMFVSMDWDRAAHITDFHYEPVDWGGFMALAIMFCLIYIIGSTLFVRKEM